MAPRKAKEITPLPGQSTLWGSTPPAKQSAESPSSSSAGKEAGQPLVQQSLWPALQVHNVESNSEGETAVHEGKNVCTARCEQHEGEGESEDFQAYGEDKGEGKDWQEEQDNQFGRPGEQDNV